MANILVTGAGGGIGRALVERGLARGDRVVAAMRSERDLTSFAEHGRLRLVRMDVSSTPSVDAAFEEADAWLAGEPLKAVVNCAAVCPLGAVEVEPPELLLDTLNTNAVGSARVLRAALPRLRGRDGRIALVTSLWGKVSGPMLSAYCSSKFAIEALADATRRETHGQGVHVILVEPGVVRTGMVSGQIAAAKAATAALSADHAAVYGRLYRGYSEMIEKNSGGGVSADQCAAGIEAAIFARTPKPRYVVGADAKAVTSLARLLPDRAFDSLFRALIKA